MSDSVFDGFVDDYDEALEQGLSLSGENRDYFARARVAHTQRICSSRRIQRVVDFGCGVGHSVPYLSESFGNADVVGVDSSAGAIAAAVRQYGRNGVSFTSSLDAPDLQSFDLAYSNGTFHHIPPAERDSVVARILRWLEPGGLFALWENNPWNPGTRLIMKRIPFDRDAQTLSYLTAERLLCRAGFEVMATSFHFYFPASFRMLRPIEAALRLVPFGAQYCVMARKPASGGAV